MKIATYLTFGNDVNVGDADDDDSPLLHLTFSNEANQVTEEGRLRIGRAMAAALTQELISAGVLVKPLFFTVSGKPIYHGDEFWCFYEGQKHSANLKRANSKFDYNDGEPRFATKEEAQEAIRVYTWLNGPYDGQQ